MFKTLKKEYKTRKKQKNIIEIKKMKIKKTLMYYKLIRNTENIIEEYQNELIIKCNENANITFPLKIDKSLKKQKEFYKNNNKFIDNVIFYKIKNKHIGVD